MRPRFLVPIGLVLALAPRGGAGLDLPSALTGADVRVERFVLTTPDAAGRPAVAGFVEWRRREGDGGAQLECDTRFLVGAPGSHAARDMQRVLHVETPRKGGPRILWREVSPGVGRAVEATWSEDGRALDIREWSGGARRDGTLVVTGGASMPLYLVELLREGRLAGGRVGVFDPLGLTLEPLDVRTVWLDDAQRIGAEEEGSSTGERAVRTIELVREDGTLAGRYRFRGRDLVAFQWQDGPLFARRADAEEYERLLAEHGASASKTGR